jgi:hypothetical protein
VSIHTQLAQNAADAHGAHEVCRFWDPTYEACTQPELAPQMERSSHC